MRTITRKGRPPRPYRRYSAIPILSAVVVGLALIGPVSLAAAAKSNPHLTPLQQGLKFYRGKTIIMIVNTAPGGAGALEAMPLGQAMGVYLHASVENEYIAAGNTITGQDLLAASKPNGLTIGYIHIATDIENTTLGLPGLNFNPIREAYLGATLGHATIILANPSSPYTTFESAMFGTTDPVFLTSSGGAKFTDTIEYNLFDFKVRMVSAYANTAALLTGFLRGDGPIVDIPIASAAPLLAAHQAIPVFIGGSGIYPPSMASYLKGVPTLATYEKAHPLKGKAYIAFEGLYLSYKLADIYAVPSKTPGPELAALRAAYEWASKSGYVKQQFSNAGIPAGYVSPTNAKIDYEEMLKGAIPDGYYYNLGT